MTRRSEARALGLFVLCALSWIAWQQAVWGYGAYGWADWYDFMASGWAASQGHNPYLAKHGPNMNPPALLPLFALLWQVPWWLSLGLVKVLGMGALAGALWITGVFQGRRKWLVAGALAVQAGISESIFNGQIYGFLALLVAWAWVELPRRRSLAGLLLGLLVAVKPNFGLVGLMMLGAPGSLPVLVWMLLGFGAANVLPLGLWGFQPFQQWFDLVTTTRGYINQVNGTFAPIALTFGWGKWWISGGIGVALLSWWWLFCSRASLQSRLTVGIGLGIVLAPISWVGYSVILLPLVLAGGKGRWALLGSSLLLWPLVPVFPYLYDMIITVTNPLGLVWLTICSLVQAGRTSAKISVAFLVGEASARRQELGEAR